MKVCLFLFYLSNSCRSSILSECVSVIEIFIFNLEIRSFANPDWQGSHAVALRRHMLDEPVETSIGGVSHGCPPCKRAGTTANVANVHPSRSKEVIIRVIRDVATNSHVQRTNKLYLEWSRGILVRRDNLGKGFDFNLRTPQEGFQNDSCPRFVSEAV